MSLLAAIASGLVFCAAPKTPDAGATEPAPMAAAVLKLASTKDSNERGCLTAFHFDVDHYVTGSGPKTVSIALPCGTDIGDPKGFFGAAIEVRKDLALIQGIRSAPTAEEAERGARISLEKAEAKRRK